MAKTPFMPRDDDGKRDWLANFSSKLGHYAGSIGVTGIEVTATQADSAYWTWVLTVRNLYTSYAQLWTAFKNTAREGVTLGANPVAPAVPAAPTAVPAGIFTRASLLAARIKKHPGCTPAIAQDLNIVGAAQAFDATTMKPVLTLILDAGQPNVGWKKQGMEGIQIWVDRGDGKGFVFLAVDTVPDYRDTAALPAPGASAVWKYKAIYLLNDEQVGQWSDVASISVMGA